MKILVVAPYYVPYTSGMTVYLQRLVEGLAKDNEVTILTAQHDKNLPMREIVRGVDVIRTPVAFTLQRGAFSPSLIFRFMRIVGKYDVVNIHAPFFEAGLIGLMTRIFGRKYVLTYICDLRMLGSSLSIPGMIEHLYYFSVKFAAWSSEKVVVLSKDYMESSRLKGFAHKSVAIIPPIDTEKFKKVADVSAFENSYGINKEDVVIGFLGRLTHEKGVEYLISAAPRILERSPSARIVVAGEGENVAGGLNESVKAKLEGQAKSLGLGDKVVFTGYLDEASVLEFYSRCDVFVLPSIDPLEAFGMVQVEAMLCGTPVVATDMPGIREAIRLTGYGRLVPPKDSEKLAAAIIDVLNKRGKFNVPREKIVELFSAEKTVAEYEKVFEMIYLSSSLRGIPFPR